MQKQFLQPYRGGHGLTLKQIAWKFDLPAQCAIDYYQQLFPGVPPTTNVSPSSTIGTENGPLADIDGRVYQRAKTSVHNLQHFIKDIQTDIDHQQDLFDSFTKEVSSW